LEGSAADRAGLGGAIDVVGHPVTKQNIQPDKSDGFAVKRFND
jgi:hypothetical protein